MATNFPDSLDSLTNPTSSDTLASVPHASQHANVNDAVEALEAKVGANSASSTSTLEVRAPKICTSSTRPTGVLGRTIFETDTGTLRFFDGTVWVGVVPTGTVQSFAGVTAPTGWLLCFGQAVSRTTYADLFTALSTTYGVGDGSTTFNLPDLRGRVPAGKDNMGGSSANRLITVVGGGTLGASGGTEQHTLTISQMPSHTHTQNAHDHSAGSYQGLQIVNNAAAAGGSFQAITAGAAGSTTNITINSRTATNQNEGGSNPHSNTQPTIVLNYIIKV